MKYCTLLFNPFFYKYQGYNKMFWSSLNAQIKQVGPEEVAKVIKTFPYY